MERGRWEGWYVTCDLKIWHHLWGQLVGEGVWAVKSLKELCSPTPRVTHDLSLTTKMAEEERIRAEIQRCWEDFIFRSKDPREMSSLRPEIAESWIRSRDYGVDPFAERLGRSLDPESFQLLLRNKEPFLQVALPFVRQLGQLLWESGYITALTDEKGVMLNIAGDDDAIRRYREINLAPGVMWSEEIIGTSAHGNCLLLKTPLQVAGPEHYSVALQKTTCSSAPIFGPDGKLEGVLAIASLRTELTHPHTLGLVTSVAWAIQNQLQLETKTREIYLNHSVLKATLAAVGEAIVTLDAEGRVSQVNREAKKLLGIQASDVLGRHFEVAIGHQPAVNEVLRNGKPLNDIEVTVEVRGTRGAYCASVLPILDRDNKVQGAVLSMKPMERIRSLVNRMGGAEAVFTFKDIIGNTSAIRKCIEKARQAAASTANILLLGESGTGKELFAQAIHNASSPSGPFVAVNCAAIPRSLIESELFGYEGGAFTGAERRGRPGKLELANGGTLFLDEIGDMPLEVQPVLLRVLEEKKVLRLGGSRYIPVDFRVIAATNQDLLQMVREKRFRHDLYFRLAAFCIRIPPLRERKEDIILLAQHFANIIGQRMGLPPVEVSDEAQVKLASYSWPGNVRELENAMVYALSSARDGIVKAEDLPDEIQNPLIGGLSSENELVCLEEVEKQAIIRTLKQTGSTRIAAQVLGIGRTTLYRKLKRYGIEALDY